MKQQINKPIMPSLLKEGGPLAVGGFNKHRPAKRIVSLILSLAMLLTLTAGIDFSVYAWDNEGKYGDWSYHDHFTGEFDENGLGIYDSSAIDITGYSGFAESLVIPDTINGYPVKGIGYRAFEENYDLISVVIPEGVIYISDYSFSRCYNLSSVKLPESLTKIERYAFYKCYELDNIVLPENVNEVEESAFESTSMWDNSSNWTENLFYIGNDWVDYKKNNDEENVKYTLNLRDNTERIFVDFVNWNFKDYKSVYISKDNKYFATIDGVLYNKNLTELIYYPRASEKTFFEIPYGVKSIPDGCFSSNEYLKNVKIPESVEKIGYKSFNECINLTSIDIPNSVTEIGVRTFENCKNLNKVILSENINEIPDSVFRKCISLTEIHIPENVNSIGFSAFDGTGLVEVKLPETVKCIDNYAFSCKNLNKINLPNDCDISGRAFFDSALYNDAKNWENGVFYLQNYCICGKKGYNDWETGEFKGYDYKGTLKIKDGTKYICSGAFNSGDSSEFNTTIKKAIIPDSVTTVYNYVFGNVINLETIEIGSGVSYIGDGLYHINKFFYNSKFKSFNVNEKNLYYSSFDGFLYNKDKTKLLEIPDGKNVDSFTTPQTVKEVNVDGISTDAVKKLVLSENVEKVVGNLSCEKLIDELVVLNKYCDFSKEMMYSDRHSDILIKGYKGSTAENLALKMECFEPARAIDRAMMVTILYRMAGEPYANGGNPYTSSPFTDITDTSVYYYDAACWALKNGVTTETTFKPFNNVTREQTATFLYRYAQDNGTIGDEAYKNVNLNTYHDGNSISHFAVDAMKWANYNSMITGTEQGYANPQGSTQRIHATKILYGFGKTCNIGNFE